MFHAENHRTIFREILEDPNKWRDRLCSLIGQQYCKDPFSPDWPIDSIQFQLKCQRFLSMFLFVLVETDKLVLKCI